MIRSPTNIRPTDSSKARLPGEARLPINQLPGNGGAMCLLKKGLGVSRYGARQSRQSQPSQPRSRVSMRVAVWSAAGVVSTE